MKDKQYKNITLIIISILVGLLGGFGFYNANKDKSTEEVIGSAVNEFINYYGMTQEEIEELPSTEIIEQTQEQENAQEQEVEDEGFELQGEIAYEGDKATTWDVELGDYKSLVYYSQLDGRWSRKNVQLS